MWVAIGFLGELVWPGIPACTFHLVYLHRYRHTQFEELQELVHRESNGPFAVSRTCGGVATDDQFRQASLLKVIHSSVFSNIKSHLLGPDYLGKH